MKAAKKSEEDEKDSCNDDDDEKDEIAYLAERISKAWIKRKKKKGYVPKKDKKGKAKQSEVIFFECKEPGHVRSKYPRLKKKPQEEGTKKKAMMATWQDLDEEQEGAES